MRVAHIPCTFRSVQYGNHPMRVRCATAQLDSATFPPWNNRASLWNAKSQGMCDELSALLAGPLAENVPRLGCEAGVQLILRRRLLFDYPAARTLPWGSVARYRFRLFRLAPAL